MEDKEKIREALGKITKYAMELYELMPHGDTIQVSIPEKQNIDVPGVQPRKKVMLITKPKSFTHIEGKARQAKVKLSH